MYRLATLAALTILMATNVVGQGTTTVNETASNCVGGKSYEGLLVVPGSATVSATPDAAVVYLTVEATDLTATKARTDAAQATDKVIAALENSGIPRNNITTENINLNPSYDYINNQQTLRGYTFSQTLKVDIGSLTNETLSSAIDSAVTAGGNNVRVQSITMDLSPALKRESMLQAKKIAVADGKANAAAIAVSANVTLSTIKEIDDNSANTPVPIPYTSGIQPAMADVAAKTPVTIGTQDVTASVTLKYAFCNPTA